MKKLLSLFLLYSCASVALNEVNTASTVNTASAANTGSSVNTSNAGEAVVSAKAISTFLDKYYQQHQANTQALGIAVSLVQKDQQDVLKGYGMANLAAQTAVSTDETVFRIASVSKVFVAVAVLQQVEQGHLNLDTDINQYLTLFQVPATFKQAITLRHLLTHTAGFEDQYYADLTLDQAKLQALGAHLATTLPQRVSPVGQRIAYSNYGSALAAFIVEQVSGLDFADYMQQYILQPIGMHHSGYRLADITAGQLAQGYQLQDGDFIERPYTWVHRYPPTSMMTTAHDMALFMQMLLNGGTINQQLVLSQHSVDTLFSQQFSHDADLPGMSLSLMQWDRNGQHTYYHDGGHFGFIAQLVLNPAKGSGYFIASNQMQSRLPEDLRYDLQQFLYAKAPVNIPNQIPPLRPLDFYSGIFVNNRSNQSSFEKFGSLFEQEINVSNEQGQLKVLDRLYQPYGEHRFVHPESGHRLVFAVNPQGQVAHLYLDWSGAPRALEKRQWFATATAQLALLAGLLLSTLLLIARFLLRYFTKQQSAATIASRLNGLALGCNLLFGVAFLSYFAMLDTLWLRAGQMFGLKILLLLPLLAAVSATMSMFYWVVRADTTEKYWNIAGWLINLGLLLYWWHWNLLGYHFS